MSSKITAQTITLADNRKLGYSIYGDPGGFPMLFFHGWPGTRLDISCLTSIAKEHKVKIIGIDRPGMAYSTFQNRRKISDWPSDVLALINHLKLDEYSILAFSTGAFYAIECALQFPGKIKKIGLVSAVPYYKIDWSGTSGQRLYRHAKIFRHFPFLVRPVLRIASDVGLNRYKRNPTKTYLNNLKDLSKLDRKLWEREDIRKWLFDEFLPDLLLSNRKGVAYDLFLLKVSLGSAKEYSEIPPIICPIFLWHGDNDDIVPHIASIEQNKIFKDSKLTVYSNEGHKIIYSHFAEIIEELK
ncbi:MAG: alpha/beta fold hydrolase [Candidatus Heimdallarchaeota archaeon]